MADKLSDKLRGDIINLLAQRAELDEQIDRAKAIFAGAQLAEKEAEKPEAPPES